MWSFTTVSPHVTLVRYLINHGDLILARKNMKSIGEDLYQLSEPGAAGGGGGFFLGL
jgi:hypothetical protein